jgi:hypothetical protein
MKMRTAFVPQPQATADYIGEAWPARVTGIAGPSAREAQGYQAAQAEPAERDRAAAETRM